MGLSKYTGISGRYPVEFKRWLGMRGRVKRNRHYKGRVSICERWSVFANFLEDMGTKPDGDYWLDRIDANGNYEPSNCRWAPANTGHRRQYINKGRLRYMRDPLYLRIATRFALMEINARIWQRRGLPYKWVKALAIQGRLYFHEGLWFLEWDGEEFEIDDKLRGQITTEQGLRASLRGKPKA